MLSKLLSVSLFCGGVLGHQVRVTKGGGWNEYGSVRVTLVSNGTESFDEKETTAALTYSSPFTYRWTDFSIRTGLQNMEEGSNKLKLGGIDVTVDLPKEGSGVEGIFVADPCVSSKWISCLVKFDVGSRLPALLNAASETSKLDFFGILGDNFYDRYGHLSSEFFARLSPRMQETFLYAVIGNHDYWVYGTWLKASKKDQMGYGFAQFYPQDTQAARGKGEGTAPFDFSVDPNKAWWGTEEGGEEEEAAEIADRTDPFVWGESFASPFPQTNSSTAASASSWLGAKVEAFVDELRPYVESSEEPEAFEEALNELRVRRRLSLVGDVRGLGGTGPVAHPSNFFFFNQLGDLGFVGYTPLGSWEEMKPWFEEACTYMQRDSVKHVYILNHWNKPGMGAKKTLETPAVWRRLPKEIEACTPIEQKLRYAMGHEHCNRPEDGGRGLMVGGTGMTEMMGCQHAWGFAYISTKGKGGEGDGDLTVAYFTVATDSEDKYSEIMECLREKGGPSQCLHLADVWIGGDAK